MEYTTSKTNLSCIIVDDEKSARNILTKLIESEFPQLKIVATANDVPSAAEKIKEFQPQLVFLDVQMPNYAGYEIIDFLPEIPFEIIFITAFDNYAIQAFELNAIDYIVKPINRNRLRLAIEKVEARINESKKVENYDRLLNSFKSGELKKLILPEMGARRVVDLAEVVAIEANGSYSEMHMHDESRLTVSKNLSYFEELLEVKENFFRSHRSWIINMDRVESIDKTKLELTHTSGFTSSISRKRLDLFFEKYIH